MNKMLGEIGFKIAKQLELTIVKLFYLWKYLNSVDERAKSFRINNQNFL